MFHCSDNGRCRGKDGTCICFKGWTGSNCSISTPVCGDGVRVGNEECDDSGVTDGDGCSSTCTVECGFKCSWGSTSARASNESAPDVCLSTCGDGLRATNEDCDDCNS